MFPFKVFVLTSGDLAGLRRTLFRLEQQGLPPPTAILLDEPNGWRLDSGSVEQPILGTSEHFLDLFLTLLSDSPYFLLVKDDTLNIFGVKTDEIIAAAEVLDRAPAAVSFILSGVTALATGSISTNSGHKVISSTGDRETTHSCDGAVTLFKSEVIRKLSGSNFVDSFGKISAYINEQLVTRGDHLFLSSDRPLERDRQYNYRNVPTAAWAEIPATPPRFCAIVSSFNRPEYVRRTVESIYRQTEQDFEVFVVNDGGVNFEDQLTGFDKRLTIINCVRNSGPGNARNIGLRSSTAKFVSFVDDDDWLLPNHFSVLGAKLESGHQVAYSFASRCYMDGGDCIVKREIPYQDSFNRDKLFLANYLPILSVMFRRTCLDVIGYFDSTLPRVEDWDFWRRLGQKFDFAVVPLVTSEFRWDQTGSTMTSSSLIKFVLFEFDVRQRMYDEFFKTPERNGHLKYSCTLGLKHVLNSAKNLSDFGFRALFPRPLELVEKLKRYSVWYPWLDEINSELQTVLSARNGVRNTSSALTCDCLTSIIIPLHNAVHYTVKLLNNLNEVIDFSKTEIVLVDNASDDGTLELLPQLTAGISYIRNETNHGFATACNQGARQARGRYIVFLNNDTLVAPDWLAPLLQPLIDEPEVGIVGNLQIQPETNTLHHAGVTFRSDKVPYHIFEDTDPDDPRVLHARDVECVTGSCMALRKADFLEVGGFDEGYLNGFEDVDLCLEFRKRNKVIRYTPASMIYHFVSRSPGRFKSDSGNFNRLLEKRADQILDNSAQEKQDLEPYAERHRHNWRGGRRVAFVLGADCGGMTLTRLVRAITEYSRNGPAEENPFLVLAEIDINNDKGWPWFVVSPSDKTIRQKVYDYSIDVVVPVGKCDASFNDQVVVIDQANLANIIGGHSLGNWQLSKTLARRIFPVGQTEIIVCTDALDVSGMYPATKLQATPPLLVSVGYTGPETPHTTNIGQWLLGESLAALASDFVQLEPEMDFELQVLRDAIKNGTNRTDRPLIDFLSDVLSRNISPENSEERNLDLEYL